MAAVVMRLLGWQGIAGIGVALVLSILLVVQKGETRHWKKQSAGFEQLYHQEQAAFATTVANYRAAAAQARAADQANAARAAAEQAQISREKSDAYETRLAAARAEYQRLRGASAAHPGGSAGAPVSGLSAPAGQPARPAGEDGLPLDDRFLCTAQSIQLDELIKWSRAEHAVDPNGVKP
jgi:hypothetical protein